MSFVFDESREFHPMRECIGKRILATANSDSRVSLTFDDGTVLAFDIQGHGILSVVGVMVSLRERPKP